MNLIFCLQQIVLLHHKVGVIEAHFFCLQQIVLCITRWGVIAVRCPQELPPPPLGYLRRRACASVAHNFRVLRGLGFPSQEGRWQYERRIGRSRWREFKSVSNGGGSDDDQSLDKRVWPIAASNLLMGSAIGVMLPIMPLFAAENGISTAQLGAAVSAMGISRLLFNVPAAWAVEKFGRRPHRIRRIRRIHKRRRRKQ